MKIVLVHNGIIPVTGYGGIERVIWNLGKELVKQGHKVIYLVPENSACTFADVIKLNPTESIEKQIPVDVDLVHFHFQPFKEPKMPYLVTIHGNLAANTSFFRNTCYVSQNHAERHNSSVYIYNGLDWSEYGLPDFNMNRTHVHFLGKAAWKVKNVRGAIRLAAANHYPIRILGGWRVNFKMGFRLTLSSWAKFHGMVDGTEKFKLLNSSKAMINPVLWHEPFGLAIIESLYFGCPVLGTQFGSLPELIGNEYGFLSNSEDELIHAFERIDSFDRKKCHEYVLKKFNSVKMTENYLGLYEKILKGEEINKYNSSI
jgi:glycosyltransferase involved in cell wall biosynthesis